MHRSAALLLVLIAAGCSPASDTDDADTTAEREVEDGGTVDAQRDQAEAYLIAISTSATLEEERQRVTELAAWLNEHDYKLQVEEKEDGIYTLSCPHFPPVTPWTDHAFLNPAHLQLLPQQEPGP